MSAITNRPSGLYPTRGTPPLAAWNGRASWPVARSQTFGTLVPPLVNRYFPSGLKARLYTECSDRCVRISLPVAASHTCTVWAPPAARYVPSGLNATLYTPEELLHVLIVFPVVASHTGTKLPLAYARCRPSGLKATPFEF